MIIDGTRLAKEVEASLKEKIVKYHYERKPKLAIILIGSNPDSLRYIKRKNKKCDECGIDHELFTFEVDASVEAVISTISRLNVDERVDGILMQMPLPVDFVSRSQMSDVSRYLLDHIVPDKDVDGLGSMNIAKYVLGDTNGFVPATPQGVMYILQSINCVLEGKHVVIIGRSMIVGKPLAFLLLAKDAVVTITHSKTSSIADFTKDADIVIAAAGRPGLVQAEMIREGAVVIDVGISVGEDKSLSGDVDFNAVAKKASYITPVPGGVGPLTVAFLLDNLVKAYTLHHEKPDEQKGERLS